MQIATYFDQLYREHDRYWWRDKDRYAKASGSYPYSLLTQLTLRILEGGAPGGRVLDLGAGEGSDSIRLALLGYQVDSVEISHVAADKIKKFADEAGAAVNVTVADIVSFEPPASYDVVICNGVLHYIEDKQSVVERMQKATKDNGINVISLWSTYSEVPRCHNIAPVFCDDENGIVTKLYESWNSEFLYYERDKPETAHGDLPGHSHSHIKLISRKFPV